jgi:chemotaxis protein methyltransferase CheR
MRPDPGSNDVERFRTAVGGRLGLAFEDSKLSFLCETLANRSAAVGISTADYVQRLEVDGSQEMREEVGKLAQVLTVTETFFFRNSAQIRAFEATCLQPLATRQEIRVLSAGCASGEEPYSLAIALLQRWPEASLSLVSIRGMDVNPAMLARARAARYSDWALRETPAEVQKRWFRRDGRESVLHARVQSLVTLEERNLVDDEALWPPRTYHAIFCRNVLMYLTAEKARRVVAKLAHSLRVGGMLFLGHAETLRNLSNEFHLLHTHGAFYYQLREASQPDSLPSSGAQVTPAVMAPLSDALDTGVSWVEAIQQSSDRVLALSRSVGREAREPPAGAHAKSIDLGQIFNLVREERFEDALALLDELPPGVSRDPDVLQLTAALLVHAGKRSEAQRLAGELLRIDELNVGAHFVLALCSEHSGEREAAIDHNRLAIHLDPTFSMPHLHLGILAKRADQRELAHREFSQALDLLGREDASRLLLFGGGFGREALVAFCQAELTTCERT